MKMISLSLLVLALVAGCATAAAPPPPAGTVSVTGEVWTWDEKENIVTLRQGGQIVRLRITPDQIRRLTLHQTVTLRGELAEPAVIEHVMVPPTPMVAVPRGNPEVIDLTGSVTSADSAGRMSLSTSRGPIQVLGAPGADSRFRPGTEVTVRTSIQPVDMVPLSQVPAPASVDPAASPPTQPGDYSVVRGRIMRVDTAGSLMVEAPQGAVEVRVPEPTRYRVGQHVQVRTVVSPR